MTDLSPQAQAVLDATDYPEDWATRIRITSALRALVIQLQYDKSSWDEPVEHMVLDTRAILDVVDELEGNK